MALSALPIRRRILLVGDGEGARVLLQVIKENAVNHYEIVGWVSGTGEDALREERIVHLTGSVQQLPEVVARERVDELGLALSDGLDESMLEVLTVCREQGLQITTMTDLYEQLTGRVPVEHVGKEWFVALPWDQESARGFSGIAKRILDVALAVAGLVVSAPLWLIIMSAIRLDSSGSIFYHQPRVGKNGCIFDLIKFRTMVANAEEPGQPVWAARQDPRITRVGRVLRRLRLDELPQFVNVLKGEMSLVGPRPERPELVSTLEKQIPFYRMRHTVRPGVTGWAAIHFGYGRSVEDALVKLQYDLYYIKHQSLYLDLLILAKTLGAVLVLPDRGG
jgi:exopolysaccharide biosynthesis polyprenyl glycosylphosphotransferase